MNKPRSSILDDSYQLSTEEFDMSGLEEGEDSDGAEFIPPIVPKRRSATRLRSGSGKSGKGNSNPRGEAISSPQRVFKNDLKNSSSTKEKNYRDISRDWEDLDVEELSLLEQAPLNNSQSSFNSDSSLDESSRNLEENQSSNLDHDNNQSSLDREYRVAKTDKLILTTKSIIEADEEVNLADLQDAFEQSRGKNKANATAERMNLSRAIRFTAGAPELADEILALETPHVTWEELLEIAKPFLQRGGPH